MTITPQEWADAGRTRAQLRTELRNNRLVRLRRGVYTRAPLPEAAQAHRLKLLATAPALGAGACFAFASAAVVHKLPLLAKRLAEVVVVRTSGGHGSVSRTLHARTATLGNRDVTLIEGLRTTSLVRTVADLVRTLPFPEAVMVADAGLARGLTREELLASTSTGRGCRMARRALLFADGRSESPGESLSRVRIDAEGLPVPELQHVILDRNGRFLARTDFAWEALGIVGEFDGATKYGRLLKPGQSVADVIKEEKQREQALIDHGWIVIRWTWDDLRTRGFEDRLRRAIESRRELLASGMDWRR